MINSGTIEEIVFDINGEVGQGDSLDYRKIGSATLKSTSDGCRFLIVVSASPVSFKRALLTPTSGVLGTQFSKTFEVLDKVAPKDGAPLTYRIGKLIPVRLDNSEQREDDYSGAASDDYCFELVGLMGHFWQCGSFTAEEDPHAQPEFFTSTMPARDTAA